ncbi:hypothetical protein E0700_03665 [Lactobacillus helveticus]|nr:hypothetical protein [Lactobacillus helveticus]
MADTRTKPTMMSSHIMCGLIFLERIMRKISENKNVIHIIQDDVFYMLFNSVRLNAYLLCNENKQLGERTKNTSPSIDEGMNLVFLLLFCLNLSL